MMYPQICVNIEKLKHNTNTMVKMCMDKGITSIFGVIKVISGDKAVINAVMESGITHIADSRIENLQLLENYDLPKVLVRLPMISEVEAVVKYSDISLNSEIETIKQLNDAAAKINKIHQIVLMFDLGDLREGIWYDIDYLPIIEQILNLENIKLLGIGTNLTCYGAIIPSVENIGILNKIKETIEDKFSIQLEVISGGNSSSLHFILDDNLPKVINNLRLGEAIFLGRETAYEKNISELYQNIFTLKAEIIELKTKPSMPIGESGVDAFGNKPVYEDIGIINRAIVAVGKQDVYPGNIWPIDKNIKILGASSDHLIIDVTKSNYKLGEIISFGMSYGGLLQLMTSKYVKKVYE